MIQLKQMTTRFLLIVSFLLLPFFAFAQSTTLSDLETKIAALLSQIQTLQTELQTLKTEEATETPQASVSSSSFTTTLGKGSEGANVTRLQQYLASDPTLYPEGLITGYFGSLTEAAVKRFQTKHNIVSSGTPLTTGYGHVGPATRAKLNALLTSSSPTPTPTPPPTPPPTTPNRSPNLSITGSRTLTLPNKATLTALATDDGLPVRSTQTGLPTNSLTYFWSKASGPGTATFSSLTTNNTTITFSSAGTYQITATVSDGDLFASYTIALIVSPATTATTTPPVTTTPVTLAPTLSFSASQTTLTRGSSTTLSWSSTNALSCSATQGPAGSGVNWSGSKTSSGSTTFTPTTTTTYTLTCKGGAGLPASEAGDAVAKSVTVTVTNPTPQPEPEPTPTTGWQAVPLITAESRARGNTGGEGGQNTRSLAIDSTGNFLLLGVDVSGLYRSLDGGKNWEPANIGLNVGGIPSIAIDPNNSDRVILIGGHNANLSYIKGTGIYLSTDRGRTWSQRLQSGTDNWFDINQIAWDPSSVSGGMSKIAYWSSSSDWDTGLFKTTDGGLSWTKVNANYGNGSVAVHPTKGYVYITTSRGFFRSTDGGANFTQILNEPLRGVSTVTTSPDLVAVSGNGDGNVIKVSNDGGLNFTKKAGSGLPTYGTGPYGIRISPANTNYMMIAYNGPPGYWWDQGMWYSHDGGDTWDKPIVDEKDVFYSPRSKDDFNAKGRVWHPTNQNILFITTDWILKSTDGGAHVSHGSDGYNGTLVVAKWAFNPFNPDLIAFGVQDWVSSFSTDGGYTWVNFPYISSSYGAYAFSKDRLFFGGSHAGWHGNRTLNMSFDGGKTWTEPGPTSNVTEPAVSGDPRNSNVAFWANWRTGDQGATWKKLDGADRVYTYNPTGAKELYGTHGNSVVKSTDHGVSWSKVFDTPDAIWDLAYDQVNKRFYVSIGDRGDTTTRLYQWQNGTLSDITDRLAADQHGEKTASSVAVDPIDPSVVYASGGQWQYMSSAATMRSTDAGATWKSLTLQPGDTGIDGGGRHGGTVRVHPVTRELWKTAAVMGIWKYPAP